MVRYCIFICLFFGFNFANAQLSRDTLYVKDVEIRSQRIIPAMQKVQAIDSTVMATFSHQDLTQLLDYTTTLSLKNYGVGAAALLSFRGTNTSQTKVLWNGLPINSPMLGMTDFSTLPAGAVNDISLSFGGSSATNGSGAIGGVISLDVKPLFVNHLNIELSQQFGSFHRTSTGLAVTAANSKWYSKSFFNIARAKNDFAYINRTEYGKPGQIMQDAAGSQHGLGHSMFYQAKQSTRLSFHTWYQSSDKNIAPPMYNRNIVSCQQDWTWRNQFLVKHQINNRFNFESSIGYILQSIRFENRVRSGLTIFTLFDTKSYFDLMTHKSQVHFQSSPQSKWTVGYEYMFEGARVEDYKGYKSRNRISLFSSLSQQVLSSTFVNLSARKEFSSFKNNPYALSLQVAQELIKEKRLTVHALLSRNYNLPTLNDLFWVPGGNPDLSAEYGWHKELGLNSSLKIKALHLSSSFNLYHAIINDWILWQPSTIANGIWSPQNLRKVQTQGIELSESITLAFSKLKASVKGMYAYTEATNKAGLFANDQSVGKQLVYVPFETLKLSGHLWYRDVAFYYLINRVGFRYTAADNIDFLPAYTIHQIGFNTGYTIRKYKLGLGLSIDNLFDTSYESIPYNPLPGRAFYLTLKLNFNTRKK